VIERWPRAMKLFGVTGGIGMGKSTSAEILARRGVPVIDTDAIAREIVEPGQPALGEIEASFGREVLDEHGRLRRDVLAETAFASREKLRLLESILHPRIRERWLAGAQVWRDEGRAAGAVIIPLLFETDAQSCFDSIICTACSAPTQYDRLRRRGWTENQIERRIAAQWPIEKKIAASHFVVWTEGDLPLHERQLELIGGPYFTGRG
jgi:dephospho-CoA kinase